jgi:DNA polymerase-3 subunit delta
MPASAPTIYLLHGEDEFAITQYLGKLEKKLGKPGAAAPNLSRLDGRVDGLEKLRSEAFTMPFMTRRRLVILTNPLAMVKEDQASQKLQALLEKIPPSTALALVESRDLLKGWGKYKKDKHWLVKWAEQNPDRVLTIAFPLPKGASLVKWIEERAEQLGGSIRPEAAGLLASLVDGNPRLADQELQKLLLYVNGKRTVERKDVELLTADSGQGDVFELVNALSVQDGRRAMDALHRLLENLEPYLIFGMIVRQFRLLILTREILDDGGKSEQVMRKLKLLKFQADELVRQAQRFKLDDLEAFHHRLLELDEAVKTGQMPIELVLDSIVVGFTSG